MRASQLLRDHFNLRSSSGVELSNRITSWQGSQSTNRPAALPERRCRGGNTFAQPTVASYYPDTPSLTLKQKTNPGPQIGSLSVANYTTSRRVAPYFSRGAT